MRVAALTTHSCSFAVNTAAISLMSSEVILVEEGGNTWSIARRHAKTGRDKESTRQQQRLARTRLRGKRNETRARSDVETSLIQSKQNFRHSVV